jgi:hypothetical protein
VFNPDLQVDDVQNLQDFLLFTVKQVKSMHAVLSALMADVAAVRRTLLQDPAEIAHYKNNLRSAIETAKPLVDEAMQSYDDMIRQIGRLEEFCN